jgi:putative transferase (TIGR04331 family)
MKKLILTNLDHFEKISDDYIFLGPWCFRDQEEREKLWDEIYFEELFGSDEEFEEASNYITNFSQHLIEKYSQQLNELHKTNYSNSYWSILLMPWIIRSLEIFFIRYKNLKKLPNIDYSVNILNMQATPIFDTSRDLFNYLLTSHGQYYSYSILINHLKPKYFKISYIEDENLIKENESIYWPDFINELRRSLKQYLNICLANISGIYIDGIKGISLLDSLDIGIKLSKIKNTKSTLDYQPVKFTNFQSKYKDFEYFIEDHLFNLIPNSFTKRFKNYEINAKRKIKLLGKKHKIAVVGAIMGGIDNQRYFLAHFKEERNGKIAISQHGGFSYGIARTFPAMAMIEYLNADYFLSWGWDKHSNYIVNAIPLASPLLSKKIHSKNKSSKDIIFIGTQIKLTNDKLASRIQTEQSQNYRKEKINFINSLEINNLNNLFYRPYFSEIDSYPERSFLKLKIPKIRFIEENFEERLLKARCLILDHPGTTFDISIAANIPTLLFWNKDSWLFTNEGEIILNKLEKSGIYHPDGKSAAYFLNSIAFDEDIWWNSKEVQEVKTMYQKKYAMISKSWQDDWVKILKKL